MKKLLTMLLGLFLISCATPPKYADISMTEPIQRKILRYSDNEHQIVISFVIKGHVGTYRNGDERRKTTLYPGINFNLMNNSDKNITIDWNEVWFILGNQSGYRIMHKETVNHECERQKDPTVILAKTYYSDIIIPCYSIQPANYRFGPKWKNSMLPPVQTTQKVDFGVFLPLQFEGDETVNYKFMFRASGMQK